jgi:pimeloyl-ACP methyl ester carboxylesterase
VTTSPAFDAAAPQTRGAPSWSPAREVVTDGRRIAVYRPRGLSEALPSGSASGSELPIVFLHGLRAAAETWSRVAAAMPVDQVMLAPDLPGFGGSEARGSYDLAAVAATLAALTLEEIDGPVDVVGEGWGATLAIAFAAARHELVRRLVVISGPWPPTLAAGPSFPAPGFTRRLSLLAGPGPSAASKVRRAYLRAGEVAGVPRPERSLVVWGARDRRLAPRFGEKVVTALGRCVDPATVEMVTLPGHGSGLPRVAPGIVASTLCEFLRAS